MMSSTNVRSQAHWSKKISEKQIPLLPEAGRSPTSRIASFHNLTWPMDKTEINYAIEFGHAFMVNIGESKEPTTACVYCGHIFRGWAEYLAQKKDSVSLMQAIILRHADINETCIVAKYAQAVVVLVSNAHFVMKSQVVYNVSLESFRGTLWHYSAPELGAAGFINTSIDPSRPNLGCLSCKLRVNQHTKKEVRHKIRHCPVHMAFSYSCANGLAFEIPEEFRSLKESHPKVQHSKKEKHQGNR